MRYYLYKFGIVILFYAVVFLTTAKEIQSNNKSNFDEYVYYQGVQGRPGVDFPVFARIPRTTFSCKQVPSGYYADLETDCQVFHICNEGSKISFLCPNGTIFQQSDLICEWWFKVNCTNSPNLYEESAEQLLEETWRRKENRRPGHQNRVVNERNNVKNNVVKNNVNINNERSNFDQFEKTTKKISQQGFTKKPKNNDFYNQNIRVPSNRNKTPKPEGFKQDTLQNRGNRKYKNPITLKRKNELNYEDSSEESQVPAETASFYNKNNQNAIQNTNKATTNSYFDQRVNSNSNRDSNRNTNRDRKQYLSNDEYPNRKSSQNLNYDQNSNQNYNRNPNQNYDQNLNVKKKSNQNTNYKSVQNSNQTPTPEYNNRSYSNPNQNSQRSSKQNSNPKYNDNLNQNQRKETPQKINQNLNENVHNQNLNQNVKINHDLNRDSNRYSTEDYPRYSTLNPNETPIYNRDLNQNQTEIPNENSNQNSTNELNSNNDYDQNNTPNNINLNRYQTEHFDQYPTENTNTNLNSDYNQNLNKDSNQNLNNSFDNFNQNSSMYDDFNQNPATELNVNSDLNTDNNFNQFTTTNLNQNLDQYFTLNPIQNTNQYTTQNYNQQYPNHKETYTEIHEPRFFSSKAYTTGTQTISPQTVSTNRIPLNDGKPFVVSTPKSSYNIREFTTENFVYSPTVPPFTTTRKSATTIPQNTEVDVTEEVTFSAPYSNVVTETQKKIDNNNRKVPVFSNRLSEFSQNENKEVQVINSISGIEASTIKSNEPEIISQSGNRTEYVRINGGSQNQREEQPSKIKLSVSTGQNAVVITTKAPIVHRRYSAAISQANPNNACIDEVVNSKGTTKKPKSREGSGRSSDVNREVTTMIVPEINPKVGNSILPTGGYSTISSGVSAGAYSTLTSISETSTVPPGLDLSTTEAQTLTPTKKPDFKDMFGGKRTESESKVIKISKYPEVHQPRSFEKATESPIYRVDLKNQAIEKVKNKEYTLKPTGFYITQSFTQSPDILDTPSTKFGGANTYLPKVTTPRDEAEINNFKTGAPIESPTVSEDFDIIQKPKPFELPPKISNDKVLATTEEVTEPSIPNYEVSSARPFSIASTIFPTQPTDYSPAPSRNPKVYEHVTNMLNTIQDLIKNNNESEGRPGLVVPPSAGPQSLHSLAVYFANALDGVVTENEDEVTTENDDRAIELLSIPTLNRYKDLFKEEDETTTQTVTEESNDLEGQHTKNGIVTPRVRQLAQVFTKALSSYLDDPDMFKKYLQEVRPTEPTTRIGTTQRSVDGHNTEEDELLNYSDADIKPDLPRLSTTPSISPTWGYILAPNNSSNFEYNSLSTDGENLQSADSQSFVSHFNNYIKERHFGKNTTPTSTSLPKDHWTSSRNATDLWRDKLYSNPLAINEDLNTKTETPKDSFLEPPEISYELRTLPKIELNSTQVHGILIDFMNTTKNENNRLNRILSKLNTTEDEFLTKMREIEQNPLTRRLILLLISECASNLTENHNKDHFTSESSSNIEDVKKVSNANLFDSSKIAENNKHVTKNSAIPKFVDQTLKDEDEDTRALELLNSLYTIASRYGK